MQHFDVFNGDADGICALHQLRLEAPLDALRVTGVKRDIALLDRTPAAAGDTVTVLDISAATNHDALVALLERGAVVRYFDHHDAGALPQHPNLDATIDPAPQVCTGLLVDRALGGRHRAWAIVAAFGDNLVGPATALGRGLAIDDSQLAALRELGESLNYNAYGDTTADVLIHPADLYRLVAGYADPWTFLRSEPVVAEITQARRTDLEQALAAGPGRVCGGARLLVLPDEAWSRRVRGALGNALANAEPNLAHAVLTSGGDHHYTVSVRAPLVRRRGADVLCRAFGGNGRAAAAGVDGLPVEALGAFERALAETSW